MLIKLPLEICLLYHNNRAEVFMENKHKLLLLLHPPPSSKYNHCFAKNGHGIQQSHFPEGYFTVIDTFSDKAQNKL